MYVDMVVLPVSSTAIGARSSHRLQSLFTTTTPLFNKHLKMDSEMSIVFPPAPLAELAK